jgi:hypothetical protein
MFWPEDEKYESPAHCILDIIANTDAHYRVAVLAAKYVYEDNWSYDNHAILPRGVIISPDFDAENPQIIHIAMED